MSFDTRDYIVVLENIVSNELCDEIINEYVNDKNWVNTITNDGVRQDIRRCDSIYISDASIIQQNKEKRKSIDEKIFTCAVSSIERYIKKFRPASVQGDSGYTLLRYKEGEFYTEHTDHYLQAPRIVSCSFTLNDDFEGGDFGFFNRELIYKPPKGSALMFPSNFMYPHEIIPVIKGIRYSIVTWFI